MNVPTSLVAAILDQFEFEALTVTPASVSVTLGDEFDAYEVRIIANRCGFNAVLLEAGDAYRVHIGGLY